MEKWSARERVFLSVQHSKTPLLLHSVFSRPQSRFPWLPPSGNVHAWRSIHSELF
jgi:hypothetical protein